MFIRETPPTGKISKTNKISVPILLSDRYASAMWSGRISAKIFEPSSGGMGKRLNIDKTRFISTIEPTIYPGSDVCKISNNPIWGKNT